MSNNNPSNIMVHEGNAKPIAAIVGAGRSKFGELWYDSPEKLLLAAGLDSIELGDLEGLDDEPVRSERG